MYKVHEDSSDVTLVLQSLPTLALLQEMQAYAIELEQV
jgi:hypothetical protein